jgi:hypothetical protein
MNKLIALALIDCLMMVGSVVEHGGYVFDGASLFVLVSTAVAVMYWGERKEKQHGYLHENRL